MSWFFRKTHNLIFNRRTVSRTYTLNHTAVHCRTTEIVVYNLVSFFICIHKIARNKIFADILRFKRERHDFFVTLLKLHLTVVKCIRVHSCWSTCFKSLYFNTQSAKIFRKFICREHSVRTAFTRITSDKNFTL